MDCIPDWLRRTIAVLSLGGGAIGLVAAFSGLLQTLNVLTWLILAVFAIFYAFGIFAGVLLLERREGAFFAAKIYWGLQIPALSAAGLSYMLSSGFHLTVWYDWSRVKLGANFLFGSYCRLAFGQDPQSTGIGINLFAVAVFFVLVFYARRSARDEIQVSLYRATE